MTENARQTNDSEHDIGRKPDQTPRDQIAKTLAAGAGVAGGLAFTASILEATAVSIAGLYPSQPSLEQPADTPSTGWFVTKLSGPRKPKQN